MVGSSELVLIVCVSRKSTKKTLHNTHEILRDTSEIRGLVDALIKEVKSQQNSASPELPRDTETAITQYIKRAKTFISSDSSMTDDTVVVDEDYIDEEDLQALEKQNDNDPSEAPITPATDNLIDGAKEETLLEQKNNDSPEVPVSSVTDNRKDEGEKEVLPEQQKIDLSENSVRPITDDLTGAGDTETLKKQNDNNQLEGAIGSVTINPTDEGEKEALREQKNNDLHEDFVPSVTEDHIKGGDMVNEENKIDGETTMDDENKVDGKTEDAGRTRTEVENKLDGRNKLNEESKIDARNNIGVEKQGDKGSYEIPIKPITDESQVKSQIHSKPIKVSQEVEEKSKRALIVAAANGNLKMVAFLLDLISDVNMIDERLGTALQISIANGHDAITWKLLGHQADPNMHSRVLQLAPLSLAIQKGKNDLAKLLLDHGATATTLTGYRGSTALDLALSLGNNEMFYLLLEKGADPNIQGDINCHYPIQTAVAKRDIQAIKALVAKGANLDNRQINSLPPLSMAIKANDSEIFGLLLDLGADIHTPGDRSDGTLLNVSIWSDRFEMMQELLSRGADPNIAGSLNALFPIQTAVNKKNISVIKTLAAAGANLNVCQVLSQPPLSMTIKANDRDLFDLLLSLGADVNTPGDRADGTPLNYALRCGSGNRNHQFLELLLSNKADPNMQGDLNAQRPLQTAVALKDKPAIELLLTYGADPELATGLCPSPLDIAVKSDDVEMYMMLLAASTK